MRQEWQGSPQVHTIVDGDLVVHRIVEDVVPFLTVEEFLPTMRREQLTGYESWAGQQVVTPDDAFEITYQCYLVRTPDHLILVDSCLGNGKDRPRPEWHQRSSTVFLDALAALDVDVADIDHVVCTHLHGDHVGWHTRWVDGRWEPTFPRATYVMSRPEVEKARALEATDGFPPWRDSVLPLIECGRLVLVDDGYRIGDHCRMLPTPGHTAGHLAWCFGKDRDRFVMMGDLLHVPVQVRHPELAFSRDLDADHAARTRREFLERYCDTDTICCTGHFPSPAVGRVRRDGDGFALIPLLNLPPGDTHAE